MNDTQLIQQILLNMGDKAPLLLAFFIFVRWMWPDIKTALLEYLKIRDKHADAPDPLVGQVSAMNTTLAGLSTSLQMFIDQSRRSQGQLQGTLVTVAGLVRDASSLIRAADRVAVPCGTTARISNEQEPGEQAVESGEASGDVAARSVQS